MWGGETFLLVKAQVPGVPLYRGSSLLRFFLYYVHIGKKNKTFVSQTSAQMWSLRTLGVFSVWSRRKAFKYMLPDVDAGMGNLEYGAIVMFRKNYGNTDMWRRDTWSSCIYQWLYSRVQTCQLLLLWLSTSHISGMLPKICRSSLIMIVATDA